jgi:hypothetical protein
MMTLLGNASYFTLGFIGFFKVFGQFYLVKLFNLLVNKD